MSGVHRRGGREPGRWKGWDRQPPAAPVKIIQGPTKEPDPMTPPQAKLLRTLCRRHGEKFNKDWTKKQASTRIRQLQKRRSGEVRL